MALCLLCLLAPLLCALTSSFQPPLQHGNNHRTCLFYKTSDEKSSIVHQVHNTVLSAPTFSFETELWSQEWHDSFVRNELVDFCPPLSSQLNCLLLGGDGNVQPHGFGAPSLMTNGNPTNDENTEQKHESARKNDIKNEEQNTIVDERNEQDFMAQQARLMLLLNSQDELISHHQDDEPQTADLDCIFDQGLLGTLLLENKEHEVGLLLLEATRHIREFGVYICVTKEPPRPKMQEYLQKVGALLGMQWRFHLDGISDETHGTVSVARKYCVEELPNVGKLATVSS